MEMSIGGDTVQDYYNNRIYKYAKRLVKEWMEHKKIIISVDFDDTIYSYTKEFDRLDINRTIELVKDARELGAYIVIFTASNIDRYPFIQEYCESIKLPIDAINKNPIELPYGNTNKIFYNINLCDRSGLCESLDILKSAIYYYEKHLNQPYTT